MDTLIAILYPALLICAFFGVIILVGVGFSYWGLIIFDKQMRRCPDCGKRGGGDVVASEVIASRNYMDFKRQTPVRVTVKTYEEHYECQHCGHKWTRTAQETVRNQVKL